MSQIGLVPLRNFAIVSRRRKIYRSAQPMYNYEYKWLAKTLGIKHIINLRSEKNIDEKFAPQHGINVLTIAVKDHHPPTLVQARQFMEFISSTSEPVLFHCEHGHGRTSTFHILTMLALGMSLDRALKNHENNYHYNFKHSYQREFFEIYKEDLKNIREEFLMQHF
jgi:protein-tyrosine phosphatase